MLLCRWKQSEVGINYSIMIVCSFPCKQTNLFNHQSNFTAFLAFPHQKNIMLVHSAQCTKTTRLSSYENIRHKLIRGRVGGQVSQEMQWSHANASWTPRQRIVWSCKWWRSFLFLYLFIDVLFYIHCLLCLFMNISLRRIQYHVM